MTTTNRSALLNKIHKVLKRTHKHTPTKGDQPLLESLLFAAVLENAHHAAAQAALAKVRSSFFDWNEIRVSTAKELAEVMHDLPEALEAATRLKGILQSVFESDYSFELEHLKKQNIGAAVKRLQKLQGATPFNMAYATQTSLGGHAIPLDKGTLGVLYVLGVINEAEAREGTVPGMERAIPKSKGPEFAGLLHELGADFFANPFSTSLREFLLTIAPDAKERFPKRASKKPPVEPTPPPAKATVADGKKKEKEKPAPAKKPAGKQTPEKQVADKRTARSGKPTAPAKKKVAAAAKKTPAKALAKRRPR